jgi:hypothetical protein
VDVPVGHEFQIRSMSNKGHYFSYYYEESRLISPPYSQNLCGPIWPGGIGTCTKTMPAGGIQIEDDVYHKHGLEVS